MGTVCEAVLHGPAGFTKRVALKQLKEGGKGLVHEAKLGGLLQHPHLVEVYALEQVDGTWLCAMEFIGGGSLANYLPMPSKAVVEVGQGVARGLAHAHEAVGLVHLDLKPANLLLHHGMVKVADLGISRARGFATDGKVKGTPIYMAPEHRHNDKLDARADIYSLGVVLIELATGTPSKDPTAVAWLEPVLRRCLAEHPSDRFADMREVGRALAEIETSGPGLADLSRREAPPTATLSHSVDTYLFDAPGSEPEIHRTNIGGEPDTYVGRESEVGLLIDQLRPPGLVTLKGLGGLGKTRLARRAARQWRELMDGEAWFADLSSCTSPVQVLRSVADALGIGLSGEEEAAQVQQVGWALDGRGDVVLVLDNFEQVQGAGGLITTWRALAPQLRVLVTSREPLRLAGEHVVHLEPLSVDEGVALLIDRARARGQRIEGDPGLPELARRLDCIPLALELAAGRLGLFGVSEIIDRLDERLKLLRAKHSSSARQSTLRGALDWSWDLLSEAERNAFAQCSVFVDGFTVEAAEAVLDTGELWALDVVESLLDRSLLHQRSDGRLGMYESTRLYARERLTDPYELDERHAKYFAELGRAGRQASALGALPLELGNLMAAARAAVDHGWATVALGAVAGAAQVVVHRGPVSPALDLAGHVTGLLGLDVDDHVMAHQLAGELTAVSGNNAVAALHFERAVALASGATAAIHAHALVGLASVHRITGELTTATDLLERARALKPSRHVQGFIELEAGTLAYQRGEYDQATHAFEAIRALGARPTPHPTAGEALGNLAHIYADRGQIELARSTYRRALAVHRTRGERAYEAATLSNLGNMDVEQGNYDRAERYYTSALTMQKQSGNRRREGVSRSNLGSLLMRRGRLEESQSLFEQALAIHREVGNRRSEGLCLGNLGSLHHGRGRYAQARRSYERARDLAQVLDIEPLRGVWSGELGLLRIEQGDFEAGQQDLEAAVSAIGTRMPSYQQLFIIALAEVRQQTEEVTLDLAGPLRTLRSLGAAQMLVRALCALARLAARRRDVEEAEHWLQEAKTVAEELADGGLPHDHALRWTRDVLNAATTAPA
ncbi:MAG: tetratricopeptide repeat protein [Proteobacteria bacterium]|nr:tetratricopeptide repeat protein [Pseudomonadota bacterium]